MPPGTMSGSRVVGLLSSQSGQIRGGAAQATGDQLGGGDMVISELGDDTVHVVGGSGRSRGARPRGRPTRRVRRRRAEARRPGLTSSVPLIVRLYWMCTCPQMTSGWTVPASIAVTCSRGVSGKTFVLVAPGAGVNGNRAVPLDARGSGRRRRPRQQGPRPAPPGSTAPPRTRPQVRRVVGEVAIAVAADRDHPVVVRIQQADALGWMGTEQGHVASTRRRVR